LEEENEELQEELDLYEELAQSYNEQDYSTYNTDEEIIEMVDANSIMHAVRNANPD